MEGYICDRCGAPVQAPNVSAFHITVDSPTSEMVGTLGVKDICPDCYAAIRGIIETRIDIGKSAPDFIVRVTDQPVTVEEARDDADAD